jgi:hypothetical protein
MRIVIAVLMLAISPVNGAWAMSDEKGEQGIAPSAQIGAPPTETKQKLILRFMDLTGLQHDIDSGSFLEYLALPGGPLSNGVEGPATDQVTLEEFLTPAMQGRFKAVYAKYRPDFQREYEAHLNWEFSEDELARIVEFLASPLGKHYLDGSWRMGAYVGTNTEHLVEQIVAEASDDSAGGTE